jgi:hypothetical protein
MNGTDQHVTIVDLRIPFFRLVFFFIKVALAVIPAGIILTLAWLIIFAIAYAIVGANIDFFSRWWPM